MPGSAHPPTSRRGIAGYFPSMPQRSTDGGPGVGGYYATRQICLSCPAKRSATLGRVTETGGGCVGGVGGGGVNQILDHFKISLPQDSELCRSHELMQLRESNKSQSLEPNYWKLFSLSRSQSVDGGCMWGTPSFTAPPPPRYPPSHASTCCLSGFSVTDVT